MLYLVVGFLFLFPIFLAFLIGYIGSRSDTMYSILLNDKHISALICWTIAYKFKERRNKKYKNIKDR
jgi:hypothetical protein